MRIVKKIIHLWRDLTSIEDLVYDTPFVFTREMLGSLGDYTQLSGKEREEHYRKLRFMIGETVVLRKEDKENVVIELIDK